MPFKKGESGNPGGRPKDEVSPLARMHTADAIKRLVAWMKSENPKASVTAAIALLDRGWGKPVQAVMDFGKDDIENFQERKQKLMARLEEMMAHKNGHAIANGNGHVNVNGNGNGKGK